MAFLHLFKVEHISGSSSDEMSAMQVALHMKDADEEVEYAIKALESLSED